MNTVKLSDKHLQTINSALEVYYRLKAGQIGIALDEAYPGVLDYDARQDIEGKVHREIFPELTRGSGYSFNSPKLGDARIAYEIKKTFEEYLSVKNNDGYYGFGRSFDGPLKASHEPLPVVLEHKNYKDFPLNQRESFKLRKFIDSRDWDGAWTYVKSVLIDLPRGDSSEIKEADMGIYFIRITKPRKY